jgi:HlyD family secretion protein
MSRNKKILIGAGVVVILGAIAFVNIKFKRQEGTSVNVEGIRTRDLQAIVSASGKIQPHDSINVSSDTVGRVTELAVDEGYRVKKGQFLMQIDPILLAAAAKQQEASLEAARSTMEQLRVASESANAALKQAQDAYNRQQQLWKGGLTTKETLDIAEQTLKMRKSDAESAAKQIDTQQLRMKQEEASLESARYTLSKVRIESPIDGIVTARNIQQGETVVVGTMNNAGTVLLTIADMSNVEAQVEVDETDVPNVQLNQKAKITIDAMPGKNFSGHVVEIGNSPIAATSGSTSSTTSGQATNFLVKVKVDDTIPDIRPGFTCTAEITTATRTAALSVPIQAMTVRDMVIDREGNIVRDDRGGRGRGGVGAVQAAELPAGQERKELEGVFVVKDNKATFVPVKTGIAGEKYFEVLSGLKAGDQVIVGPFSSVRELKDGGAVKIDTTARAATVGSK